MIIRVFVKLICILQLCFCCVFCFVLFFWLVLFFYFFFIFGFFCNALCELIAFFTRVIIVVCCLPAEAEENEPRVFESEMIVRDNMYLDVTLSMCSCILHFQACWCQKFVCKGNGRTVVQMQLINTCFIFPNLSVSSYIVLGYFGQSLKVNMMPVPIQCPIL